MSEISSETCGPRNRRGLLARWKKETDGATAIEFAMVAMPFLGLLFGIIGVGLFFFTTFTLENGVDQAARLLRTGEAQTAGLTAAQFKQKVCDYVPRHLDCTNNVKVHVLTYATTAEIAPTSLPNCLAANGSMSQVTQYVPGGPSQFVVVWACYEWKMTATLPLIELGNMSNGSRLIQATAVFRTEPFGS